MRTSNIIIFLPSLSGGGAEKVIISLFENLNRVNYHVTLVVQNKIGPLKINIFPLVAGGKTIKLHTIRIVASIVNNIIRIFRNKGDMRIIGIEK